MVATAIIGAAVVGGGAAIYSANQQADAASSAADVQSASAADANANQLEMFRQSQAQQQAQFNQTQANERPFIDAGTNAVNAQQWLLGLGPQGSAPPGISQGYGSLSKPFGMSDFTADPGYQFSLDQGAKQIQQSAAAQGGLFSGATMKALQTFGQNTAAGQYQAAFDRYNQNQTNLFNRLSGVTSQGQASAGNLASAGTNMANANTQASNSTATTMGNNITSSGAAQAAGIMGNANAWSTGLNNITNIAGNAGMAYANSGVYGPITWN